MNQKTNNEMDNDKLPGEPETLLTEEAERLLRHIQKTPIESDDDLIELGRIYNE